MSAIKIIGKLNPKQYSEMLNHLTRKKIKNPFIKAKDIVVDKKPEVEEREMFNRFNQANPRQDMAGGGMLVQPGFGGTRQGYAKSKMGKSKLGEGMENIFKEKIGPGKFRYFIKVGGKKYGQAIGEENLPTLKKKRDQVIKKLYPNRITNEDFAKLKNLKKYENMDSAQFAKVLNDKGFTTISGKEWNQKSTLRKIDELDLELVGRKRSESEIFEIVKKIEGGPSKIKLYKEGIIPLETLRDIATDYEKRQSPEYKETKKKIETKAKLKKAQTLGNFPPGASPNDNLWAQVYRSAKDGDGRWKIVSKLPPLKDGKRDWVKNNSWKKMRVIDTQTGTEFGYKDLKNYLDDLEGPGTYDNALKPWQNKKDLNAIKINYRGDNVSLGKVLSNKKLVNEFINKNNRPPTGDELTKFYKERYPYGKNNFAVNHPEGVKNNWWNAEVVHKDANDRLERLDKSFRSNLNLAKNNVQRNKVIELYKKDVKKIGNVTSIFEGQTFGKSNILGATRDAFKTEGLSRTFEANRKQILNQIASFGDGTCAVQFGPKKRDGGRIGYQVGTIDKKRCIDQGVKNFNEGKLKTADQIKDGARLLRGGRAVLSALSKYGIVPELAYVGLEAAGRTVLGEKPTNALLKSIDTLTFGATDFTSEIEAEKFGEYAKDKLAVDAFRGSQAKVRSILNNLEKLEQINLEGGDVDVTQELQTLRAQLKSASDELRANTVNPDLVQFIDKRQEEISDTQLAKSPFAKQSLTNQLEGFPGIKDYMDTEATRVFPFQQTQKKLNEKVLSSLFDVKDAMQYTTSDAINMAQRLRAKGQDISAKDILAYRDSLRNTNLSGLAESGEYSPTSIYGASETFSTPLPSGALDKKPNVIPEIEREIVGQTNVANPFDIDISDIGSGLRGFAAAGGGIAKEAGDRSGPPPERGPMSQGLQGLMKRVRNL